MAEAGGKRKAVSSFQISNLKAIVKLALGKKEKEVSEWKKQCIAHKMELEHERLQNEAKQKRIFYLENMLQKMELTAKMKEVEDNLKQWPQFGETSEETGRFSGGNDKYILEENKSLMKETPIVTLDEDDDDDDDAATVKFDQNGKDVGGKESDTISEVSKVEGVFKNIDNLLSLNTKTNHTNNVTVFEVSESDFDNMELCLSVKEKNTQAVDTKTKNNLKRKGINETNKTSKRFNMGVKDVAESSILQNDNQEGKNEKTKGAQDDENQIKLGRGLDEQNNGLNKDKVDSGNLESLESRSDALQEEIDKIMEKLIDDPSTDGETKEVAASNLDSNVDSSKDSIENKHSQIKTKDVAEAKELSSQSEASTILKEDKNGYFCCNQCDYKGRNKTIVRYHVMNKHEGKTWDCSECDFKADSPKKLKNHEENKHI